MRIISEVVDRSAVIPYGLLIVGVAVLFFVAVLFSGYGVEGDGAREDDGLAIFSEGGTGSIVMPVEENNGTDEAPDWTCVDRVRITSYFTIVEEQYSGEKVNVYSEDGAWLGAFKEDFVKQVYIDGAGRGDGKYNRGNILHYDYGSAKEGDYYYLSNVSLNARGVENTPLRSVAFWPPPELGKKLRITRLGGEAVQYPDWIREFLTGTEFVVDDRLFYAEGNHLDVYLGEKPQLDVGGTPYSFLFTGARVCMYD